MGNYSALFVLILSHLGFATTVIENPKGRTILHISLQCRNNESPLVFLSFTPFYGKRNIFTNEVWQVERQYENGKQICSDGFSFVYDNDHQGTY